MRSLAHQAKHSCGMFFSTGWGQYCRPMNIQGIHSWPIISWIDCFKNWQFFYHRLVVIFLWVTVSEGEQISWLWEILFILLQFDTKNWIQQFFFWKSHLSREILWQVKKNKVKLKSHLIRDIKSGLQQQNLRE